MGKFEQQRTLPSNWYFLYFEGEETDIIRGLNLSKVGQEETQK